MNRVDKKKSSTHPTPFSTSLLPHLRKLANGAQFYWYLTLVSTLWFTLRCIISSIFRGAGHPSTIRHFSSALLSILITYIIILRQTYKNKPFAYLIGQIWYLIERLLVRSNSDNNKNNSNGSSSTSNSTNTTNTTNTTTTTTNNTNSINPSNQNSSATIKSNILRDENVQYLLFAFFNWLFASPTFGSINPSTLYPFAIYAIFHASHYTQSNIIPYLPYLQPQQKQKWCSNIIHFHRVFNERSRMIASNTEILLITSYIGPFVKLFFKIVLGNFWSSNPASFWYDFKSIILFLVTIIFLRARYEVDDYTRTQVQSYDAAINRFVWNPLIPHPLRQALIGLRKVIGDFIQMVNLV